jgi:GNAT superfamily N-acetyltransferase
VKEEMSLRFREMTAADLEGGVALCRAARWNQTRRDWELFLTLNPHGSCAAIKEERLVGTVATVRYQDRFSWIGMRLVDQSERGQGIGRRLMEQALAMLGDESTVRLDATPAGYPLYRKLGFMDECELTRMEMIVPPLAQEPDSPARPMTAADLSAVRALDTKVFGADRRALLAWQWEGAPELAWIVAGQGGTRGYCLGRRGFHFIHPGPVIAEERAHAQQVLAACLRGLTGKAVALDTTRSNAEWLHWLAALGFQEQRPLTRMCFGDNRWPGLPENQFAILGPEFG